ncbi:MAG TPA: hypothetical protein VNT79_02135 [Phycisphaerae bacterium]|nr:hypothetical protein [Phycisphaerae bacterium]
MNHTSKLQALLRDIVAEVDVIDGRLSRGGGEAAAARKMLGIEYFQSLGTFRRLSNADDARIKSSDLQDCIRVLCGMWLLWAHEEADPH